MNGRTRSTDTTALAGNGDGVELGATAPPADRSAPPDLVVVPDRFDGWRAALRYDRLAKPLIDFVAALVLVVVMLPVLLGIVVALRLTMGSPVLFRQQRVGRDGRRFEVWKFRTMTADRRRGVSAAYRGPERRRTHKSVHDPRVTRVGGVLRRWSIDELPQLWNVLRGDMSLVGPRPELVEIVERYEPWQHQRHRVKPGITGLWQVTRRDSGLAHEHVELDLEYVERVSLRTDCRILLRTVPVLVGRLPGF